MHWLSRISVGVTFVTLASVAGCLVVPRGFTGGVAVAAQRPDFSASGIDLMPVGTAKQVARMKHARISRKA